MNVGTEHCRICTNASAVEGSSSELPLGECRPIRLVGKLGHEKGQSRFHRSTSTARMVPVMGMTRHTMSYPDKSVGDVDSIEIRVR